MTSFQEKGEEIHQNDDYTLSSKDYYNLAQTSYRERRYEEAIKFCLISIKQSDKKYFTSYILLAKCYYYGFDDILNAKINLDEAENILKELGKEFLNRHFYHKVNFKYEERYGSNSPEDLMNVSFKKPDNNIETNALNIKKDFFQENLSISEIALKYEIDAQEIGFLYLFLARECLEVGLNDSSRKLIKMVYKIKPKSKELKEALQILEKNKVLYVNRKLLEN